jgi:hypothetical protein
METFQQSFGRLLAAAAFVGGAVASAPSTAFTITMTGAPPGTSCQAASVDAQNNVTINCTTSTTPPPSEPPPPPPPPPSGSISCNGRPGITNTKVIALPWQYLATTGNSTSKVGGFAPGDAVVFTITPPAGTSTGGKYASIGISPTDSKAYNLRVTSISTSPCDFSRSMGLASVIGGQSATLRFTVGGYPVSRMGTQVTSNANLTAGKTYYVTVYNQALRDDGSGPTGVNTCMSSGCNVNYQLIIP